MNNPDCRKSLTRKVFAVVCYVPFTIYGLGKLMLYEKVIDKRERSKFNRENKKHNLQALPQQRKRALTLEQPRKEPTRAPLLGRANRMTNAQKKSRLFKLPAEVRCIIWREVLGGHEITIRNWPYYDAKVTRPRNWWAIPRTCRRLYVETIDMLYTHTQFKVICDRGSFTTLLKLKNSVLPHRWDQIRSLSIIYRFDPLYRTTIGEDYISQRWTGDVSGANEWPEFCKTLQSLPNVQRVHLTFYDPKSWLNEERLLMLGHVRASNTVAFSTSYLPDEPDEEDYFQSDY